MPGVFQRLGGCVPAVFRKNFNCSTLRNKTFVPFCFLANLEVDLDTSFFELPNVERKQSGTVHLLLSCFPVSHQYSSKDQPHVEGLMLTLADGYRYKELDIAKAKEAGEDIATHELARRILHSLMAATNRRMHKGFQEMLTYLLQKPTEYCSHKFVGLFFHRMFQKAIACVHGHVGKAASSNGVETSSHMRVRTKLQIEVADYPYRPLALERFPLYRSLDPFPKRRDSKWLL